MDNLHTLSYQADLELALRLADAADAISAERFLAADLDVTQKRDQTYVTDADRAVEQCLRELLRQHRPADSIYGEEFGGHLSPTAPPERQVTWGDAVVTFETERRWVIDPIDGTHNFLRGVPVWATLIALMVGSEPVVGVVSAPALGRRWWAANHGGAFATDPLHPHPRQLQVSSVSQLGKASISYSSLTGWEHIGRLDQFCRLLKSCWRTRGYGDFWSYMLVAEGVAEIACEPSLELYDLAALVPIVRQARGCFTAIDGRVDVEFSSALATNGLLHDQVLQTLGFDRSE